MSRMCKSVLIAVSVLLAAALFTGCDGDDKSPSVSAGQGESGGGGQSQGVKVVDLKEVAATVEELKSFRFDLTMKLEVPDLSAGNFTSDDDALGALFGAVLLGALGDIKAKGAYVAPDQMEITLTLAGQEMGIVQIGNRSWFKQGGRWQEMPGGSELDFSAADVFQDDLFPTDILQGIKSKREKVNGVETNHYTLDKMAFEALARDLGESTEDLDAVDKLNLDLWLTDDNIPVKVAFDMSGKDDSGASLIIKLQMNLTDINDSGIRIRPPA